MKQSKKKQSDKNTKENLLLESFLNVNSRELLDVAENITMCKIALEKYYNVYNEVLLFNAMYKDKSLSSEQQRLRDKHVIDLDGNSIKGRLRLKACFKYVKEILNRYITDKNKNMDQLSLACYAITSYNYKNIAVKDIIRLLTIQRLVRDFAFESIGYWTAKLEENTRNKTGGAKIMKEQGNKNQEAIKNIIAELGIKSLLAFKKDKALRDNFYKKAKEKTFDKKHKVSLSEKRISDIARKILKEQGASLDTKPPL